MSNLGRLACVLKNLFNFKQKVNIWSTLALMTKEANYLFFSQCSIFFTYTTNRAASLPERIRVSLPKSRDNMVPGAFDVCGVTKIFDHISATSVKDDLNPDTWGPFVWFCKITRSWKMTPSKYWDCPENEWKKYMKFNIRAAKIHQIHLWDKS